MEGRFFPKTLAYEHLAQRIKQYGFGGIKTLNHVHMGLIFGDLPSVLSYLCLIEGTFDKRSVVSLLKVASLMCTHSDAASQVREIWHILNP